MNNNRVTPPTILFADNDPDFSATRLEALERAGYRVLLAGSPERARKLFETEWIDLAILDIRLRDDDDEKDISGLTVAKECRPEIPKIILTKFPTVDVVRAALRQPAQGVTPAIDFIAKEEGIKAMVDAVARSITKM